MQVANIAPQVSGQIVKLLVGDNQFVHKGDPLYVIDQGDYKVALDFAKADVSSKAADLEGKNNENERRRKLTDLAASTEEKRIYEGGYLVAQAAHQTALANLEQAQLNMGRTEVRSTVNCFVTNLLLRVGGTDYSLDQIENQVLRPLREPRIHFAIVCGSRGCPRLRNRAYSTSDLERQLQDNARNFFADPQKLEYDPSTGELRLSPILKWYAQDFGNSEREVLETITPYLPDRVTREGRGANRLSAGFLDYDWSLNAQAAPAPPIPPNAATASPENRVEEPH